MRYIGIYNYLAEEPVEEQINYGHCYYMYLIHKKFNRYGGSKDIFNNLKHIMYSRFLLINESGGDTRFREKILVIEQ